MGENAVRNPKDITELMRSFFFFSRCFIRMRKVFFSLQAGHINETGTINMASEMSGRFTLSNGNEQDRDNTNTFRVNVQADTV